MISLSPYRSFAWSQRGEALCTNRDFKALFIPAATTMGLGNGKICEMVKMGRRWILHNNSRRACCRTYVVQDSVPVSFFLFPCAYCVLGYRDKGIQHIAGPQSWEGYQHCLRCGAVLAKGHNDALEGLSSGHVYQVGDQYQVDPPEEFDSCQPSS